MFGDDGAGGRAAWEAEVAHRSVVHAPVDRDLDFRAANTAQRSEELIKVLANWGCVAGGREEFIDLFSAVREVGVEEGRGAVACLGRNGLAWAAIERCLRAHCVVDVRGP